MKKIYFSLMTIAALLFTACNNDEVPGNGDVKGGVLETTVTFENSLKSAGSNALPTTSWANVNQIQLFLYDAATGVVKFSAMIEGASIPTSGQTTQNYVWTNVPEGNYQLALLANVRKTSDPIETWIGGDNSEPFTHGNVLSKAFKPTFATSTLQIDWKGGVTLPSNHIWTGTGITSGYTPPSEIFTAYAPCNITEGTTTTVAALELKREISMLRVRIDKTTGYDGGTGSAPQLNLVNFDHADNFIAIRRLPVGFGMKVGSFAGGIFDEASEDRILVGATGNGIYKTNTNPGTGYVKNDGTTDTPSILSGTYTLWNDIRVLPNVSATEISDGLDTEDGTEIAPNNRRYYIILSAMVPDGYKFYDGSTASGEQPVYWGGTINGAFFKNTIREVNITITTPGSPIITNPVPEGKLIISVGAPEPWNNLIEVSEIEL